MHEITCWLDDIVKMPDADLARLLNCTQGMGYESFTTETTRYERERLSENRALAI
jgi:hypothetical protein